MKKFIVLIFISGLLTTSLISQNTSQNNDLFRFYLKSGMMLKGEIVKVIPDSIVQIKQYGLINSIKFSDIDSIVYEETKAPSLVNINVLESPKRKRRQVMDSAWHFALQTGLSIGFEDDIFPVPGLFIKGSVLKSSGKRTMYGANFGFEPYLFDYEVVIGVMDLEARYLLRPTSTNSLFFVGLGGYGFNLMSADMVGDGGGNYAFGFGHCVRSRSGVIFSVMGLLRHQEFISSYSNFSVNGVSSSSDKNQVNRVEVRVEWKF